MRKRKNLWKTLVFTIILCLLIAGVNYLAGPIMMKWNSYSTVRAFYEEPENTIETIFLGSSRTISAFDPMLAYKNYGICSYNLGSISQPVHSSYYRMVEAYRRHSETMKTVVLECMGMMNERPLARYQIGTDDLRFPTKYDAVMDYPVEETEKPYYLLPLLEYHNKWSLLTREDFEKIFYEPVTSTRGYYQEPSPERYIDYKTYDELPVISGVLDRDAKPTEINEENLRFFKKMVKFCDDNGLKLILTSTVNRWSAADHNAIAALADEYELDYFDFNFNPYFDEAGVNPALDMYERNHTDHYGAVKLTSWFCDYLTSECGATDVRGDERYAFMEEEYGEYQLDFENIVKLKEAAEVTDYLEHATANPDYTVLIAVRGTAASGLDEETKSALAAMGLTKLQSLGDDEPYLAVIDGGQVLVEQTGAEDAVLEDVLVYEGTMRNGEPLAMRSEGTNADNFASCVISGTEHSPNATGMNIVVYNNYSGENHAGAVVDSASFDTSVSSKRDAGYLADLLAEAKSDGAADEDLQPLLRQLALYNYRCERTRKADLLEYDEKPDDLVEFLKAYWNDENTMILLSVRDDGACALDENDRAELAAMGFSELSQLGSGEPYVAVCDEGAVVAERREPAVKAMIDLYGMQLISEVFAEGSRASVMIGGEEQAENQSGVNAVIYDTKLNMVMDEASFAAKEQNNGEK